MLNNSKDPVASNTESANTPKKKTKVRKKARVKGTRSQNKKKKAPAKKVGSKKKTSAKKAELDRSKLKKMLSEASKRKAAWEKLVKEVKIRGISHKTKSLYVTPLRAWMDQNRAKLKEVEGVAPATYLETTTGINKNRINETAQGNRFLTIDEARSLATATKLKVSDIPYKITNEPEDASKDQTHLGKKMISMEDDIKKKYGVSVKKYLGLVCGVSPQRIIDAAEGTKILEHSEANAISRYTKLSLDQLPWQIKNRPTLVEIFV